MYSSYKWGWTTLPKFKELFVFPILWTVCCHPFAHFSIGLLFFFLLICYSSLYINNVSLLFWNMNHKHFYHFAVCILFYLSPSPHYAENFYFHVVRYPGLYLLWLKGFILYSKRLFPKQVILKNPSMFMSICSWIHIWCIWNSFWRKA